MGKKMRSREKRWPGFASVVKDSSKSHEQILTWLGISEDTLLDWYSNGAPIAAHIAMRAFTDLGMISPHFRGWNIDSNWLIAPNNRKISIIRLSNLCDIDRDEIFRIVASNRD